MIEMILGAFLISIAIWILIFTFSCEVYESDDERGW